MDVKKRILVVEDEPDMRATLRDILETNGFMVDEAEDGKQMRSILGTHSVDLVLLDWMLPDQDGIELAHELRRKGNVPFIMLTGRNDEVDKVVGLEVGADDYITKPFYPRELTARIGAVLRRFRAASAANSDTGTEKDTVIRFDGWELKPAKGRLASPEGKIVSLTDYELRVLSALAQHRDQVLSRDQIIEIATGRDASSNSRKVDISIARIRKKLDDDSESPRFIRTVRGVGYIFAASVEEL
ncbi:MAG: response regulator transcription factor [Alphaproteobacteria bacterium]|nr:response regulator transcription factor [Alphaproteobacteria bacterium]